MALILSLCACGGGGTSGKTEDDPVLGKYEGYTINSLGEDEPMSDAYEGENFIELSSGGKGTMTLGGDGTPLTWTLDGEALEIVIEKTACACTLKDGVIGMDFFGTGVYMTFVKEGVTPPATESSGSAETADPAGETDSGAAGTAGSEGKYMNAWGDAYLVFPPDAYKLTKDEYDSTFLQSADGSVTITLNLTLSDDYDSNVEYYSTFSDSDSYSVTDTTVAGYSGKLFCYYNSFNEGYDGVYVFKMDEPINEYYGGEVLVSSKNGVSDLTSDAVKAIVDSLQFVK